MSNIKSDGKNNDKYKVAKDNKKKKTKKNNEIKDIQLKNVEDIYSKRLDSMYSEKVELKLENRDIIDKPKKQNNKNKVNNTAKNEKQNNIEKVNDINKKSSISSNDKTNKKTKNRDIKNVFEETSKNQITQNDIVDIQHKDIIEEDKEVITTEDIIYLKHKKLEERRKEARLKRKKRTTILGAIVIIFATVGFVNISGILSTEIGNIVTGKNRFLAYEDFIQPSVVMDVVPFDSVDKLDEKIRLQTAIWSIVMSKETSQYKKDETTGVMYMPIIDIEAEATRLFGSGQSFQHESFGDFESQFYFDSAQNSYKIPITGKIGYIPQITKIEKSNGLTKLTVNYIPPNAWVGDSRGNKFEPKPDKTLYYYIDKKDNKEFISKVEIVQDIEINS
ncbi:MAG: hypothetical protein ACRCZK_02925 [Oscillospiraceae bacterium]